MAFFNETPKPQGEATPSMTEVFKKSTNAASENIKVCMPAVVVRYDFKKQLIDAKPSFKRKYQDGTIEDSPVIYNVPVAFPRAGDAFIVLPLKKGHSVLLVFSDKSLEKWLSNGTENEPDDKRSHHISDAIAIPGCYPFSDPAPVNNDDDVIVKNKDLEMRIKKSGHIQVLNSSQELLKVMDEWITHDITGSHHGLLRTRAKLRTFLEK